MKLDKRFYAFRSDLADGRLRGKIKSNNFVSGQHYLIKAPISNLYLKADLDSLCLCQLFMGCRVTCFEYGPKWSWVQSEVDNYVGYVRTCDLTDALIEHTHRVCIPYTGVYAAADLKSRLLFSLPMNSCVSIIKNSFKNGFFKDHYGRYIFSSHLLANGSFNTDILSVCRSYLFTPYLWGGDSWLGIDCSGLLAQSLRSCGFYCDRDTDMQLRFLGKHIDEKKIEKNIIVFFEGHVGIMCNEEDFLHASAYSMRVEIEKLSSICKRIGKPVGYKRIV